MSANGRRTKSIRSDSNSTYTSHSLDQQQALVCDNLPQPTFELEPVHLQFNLNNKFNKLLVSNNIMFILLPSLVYRIDLDNPSLVDNYLLPGKLTNVWLNPNGKELIIQIENESYYQLHDKSFKQFKFKHTNITTIAFTNNHTLVIGTEEGHVYLYERSLKQVYKVNSPIQGIVFSSNNSQINIIADKLYSWDCFDTSFAELQKVFKHTDPTVKSINPPGILSSSKEHYLYINRDNEIITNDDEMQLDRLDDKLSQVMLSPHHIIGYHENVIKIYNKLNKNVKEITVPETKIRGITADYISNTYWVYTKNSIFELVIENESILVWYDYYKMGKYMDALKYLEDAREDNFYKRDLVLIKQGYDYLQQGGFGIVSDDLGLQIRGIQILAQLTEPFEKVCLMILNHQGLDLLLIEYLLAKLNKKNKIQMVVLSTWVIELMVRSGDARFNDFLKANYKHLDRPTMYQVLSSEKLLFYAELLEDYTYILQYHINKQEWKQAINTLIKLYTKGVIDPVYETAVMILMNYPKVTDTWLKLELQYEKLLPALLNRPELAVPFLQKVTMEKNYKKSRHVNNTYLSLLITRNDSDKQIIKFINSTSNYERNFILRLCISHKKYHAAVLLYVEMKLYEQALELALSHDLVPLAEFILSKFNDNDDKQVSSIKYEDVNYSTKRKLWLRYGKYLIDKDLDLKETLRQSSLQLKDVLMLLPDGVSVNNFKDEIVESLNGYNAKINLLSLEMKESLAISTKLKQELRDFNKNKTIAIIEPGEPCAVCGDLLLKNSSLVYFPNCHHGFHKDCIKDTSACSLCNDFNI
ncbi:Vacuolar membrane protein PEP3 [Candida viswanathii]|uniref:Vacuolar membrane protein PEP3 n=1 Tax=Candida viswanathii TaxID=5486 RepID=A0A367XRJ8_9ASCO|nr:Vacuolar membrane protein PEP3 [Candida viswanathii]